MHKLDCTTVTPPEHATSGVWYAASKNAKAGSAQLVTLSYCFAKAADLRAVLPPVDEGSFKGQASNDHSCAHCQWTPPCCTSINKGCHSAVASSIITSIIQSHCGWLYDVSMVSNKQGKQHFASAIKTSLRWMVSSLCISNPFASDRGR